MAGSYSITRCIEMGDRSKGGNTLQAGIDWHDSISQTKVPSGIFFSSCSLLVQDLLIAKRDLKLSRALKNYGRFDALMIDDIGYGLANAKVENGLAVLAQNILTLSRIKERVEKNQETPVI